MTTQMQTAIIQSQCVDSLDSLPLVASDIEPIPALPSPHHVLVRVLAVALNPNDHKMLRHFPIAGHGAGCDFCGTVERTHADLSKAQADGLDLVYQPGTRVCGTVFPYAPVDADHDHDRTGAFAEFVVVDARLLLRVPRDWTDLQGAALGGVGWSTVALALSANDALGLPGLPSTPVEKKIPVLVYGGGTATGTMAAQLLNLYVTFLSAQTLPGRVSTSSSGPCVLVLISAHGALLRSGYRTIAVTQSAKSAALVEQYGAASTVLYDGTNLEDCIAKIHSLTADGPPLRHALDCITDGDSASLCFKALARTGGRYACLEEFQDAWRTRRVVKVKEVMGYEVLGRAIDLGGPESTYTRPRNEPATEVGRRWRGELQDLLDRGMVRSHPAHEMLVKDHEYDGPRDAIPTDWKRTVTSGLEKLRTGGVRGRKLVVRISS